MINRTVLVGRLTKDPEINYTPSGIAKARFTLAISRQFTGQNGERETDFVQCIAWRKQAENLVNFQRKGNLIGVEGRIQTGSFEGQDGKRVYTFDVVAESIQFLEPKSRNEQGQGQLNQQQTHQNYGQQQNYQNQPPQGQGQYVGNGQQQWQGQPNNGYQNQQNYQGQQGDPFARQW